MLAINGMGMSSTSRKDGVSRKQVLNVGGKKDVTEDKTELLRLASPKATVWGLGGV